METNSGKFEGNDRFEVRRQLGAGGMGVVYEVIDRARNTRVALKTLRHSRAQDIYRFKNEFRALRDLQHRNLVSLGELFEEEGEWFFTMELVRGQDFLSYVRPGSSNTSSSPTEPGTRARLRADAKEPDGSLAVDLPSEVGVFDEARLCAALVQLAEGLRVLHSAGKVHRDIKPSNILVTDKGRVVLLDFGLLKETEEDRQSTELHVVGTAAYMAPEQATATNVSPASDWYSVGVLLYVALTGRLPFEGQPLEILMAKQGAEPKRPVERVDGLPEELDRLCMELLQRDPSARPDANEVLRRLGTLDSESGETSARQASGEAAHFVGRGPELELLRSAFAQTRQGESIAVAVVGESGIGKSALIRHFTAGLDGGETVVLTGRCSEHEVVPYKGFDGVVDALSRLMRRLPEADASSLLPLNAALLPRVFPVLGRVGVVVAAPQPLQEVRDPLEVRSRAFAALRELLYRLAERRALVLVIDDLQWADTDSLILLDQLLRPPDPPPLLLLISWRTADESAEGLPPELGAALSASADVRRIELQPLGESSATELATLLLAGAGAGKGLNAAEIAAEAHGHPLYIDAIVRYAAARASGRAPTHLDEALWERVKSLPESARLLVELVAVCGEPVAQETLRHAAKMSGVELTKQLSLLRTENLLRASGSGGAAGRVEVYHDRVRESVRAHLIAATRAERHQRMAVALSVTAKNEPQAMVEHWLGAGDRIRAGKCAIAAAAVAEQAMAFGRAADHYELVLDLLPLDADDRRAILAKLGDARANSGRLSAAADAYLDAAATAPRGMSLDMRRRAVEQYFRAGRLEEGQALGEELLGAVGLRMPRSDREAVVSIGLSRLRFALFGHRMRRVPPDRVSSEDSMMLDVCWSVVSSLNIVSPLLGTALQQHYVRRALRSGDVRHAANASSTEAGFSATAGTRSRRRTERALRRARALVDECKDAHALGVYLVCYSPACFMRGEFDRCVELADEALRVFVTNCAEARYEADQAQSWKLAGLYYNGRISELAREVPALMREGLARRDEYLLSSLRSWRSNFYWLAVDRPKEARRQAERCDNRWITGRSFHTYHYYRLHTDAQISLYQGRGAKAWQEVLAGWAAFEGSVGHRVQSLRIEGNFMRARCAIAAVEEGEDSGSLLAIAESSVRAVEKEGARWGEGLAALVRACLAARRGDRDAALAFLEQAEEVFSEQNMRLLARVAEFRRGQLLGGEQGEALVASATGWMREESIVNPEAVVALFSPGFAS